MRTIDFLDEVEEAILDARAEADAKALEDSLNILGERAAVRFGGHTGYANADAVIKALEDGARVRGVKLDAFPVRGARREWYGKDAQGWELWEDDGDGPAALVTAPDGCAPDVVRDVAREVLRSIAHAEGRGCGERECISCY